VHLVGFITKKFVTMHGHMKVKICRRSKHVAVLVDFMWKCTNTCAFIGIIC